MVKIASIDSIERLQQRSGDEAVAEARECLNQLKACMASFAEAYPGMVALAGIAGGESCGVIVAAPCDEGCFYSVGTTTALRELAMPVANLTAETDRQPDDPTSNLRVVFETAWAREKARRLKEDLRNRVSRA